LHNTEASPAARDDGLDPEIRAFQQRLSAGYAQHPALDGLPLHEARRIAEAVRAPFARGGPVMGDTIDCHVDAEGETVRVRVHLPTLGSSAEGAPLPALIYLHGGGWTLFSIDTHDRLMREYAQRTGVAVIGVDYALAPEQRFPRALRQVAAVVGWLRAQGLGIGVDGERLALGGDSAGANLALAASLLLRGTEHAASLRALVLNYGVFSRNVDSDSHRRFSGPAYLLNSAEMVGFWRNYLGDAVDDDPLAEPLKADLHGLPPAFLAVAQCDVLFDDNLAMAKALATSGVDTTFVLYPGTTHGFLEAMSMAQVSRRALDETAAWLHRHLSASREHTRGAP
jgi:acetyl esterase